MENRYPDLAFLPSRDLLLEISAKGVWQKPSRGQRARDPIDAVHVDQPPMQEVRVKRGEVLVCRSK